MKILELKKKLTAKLIISKTDSLQSILYKTLIITGLAIFVPIGLIFGVWSCIVGNPIFGTCLFTIGGLAVYSLLGKYANNIESFISAMGFVYVFGDGIGLIVSAGEKTDTWTIIFTGIMFVFGIVLLKTSLAIQDQYR